MKSSPIFLNREDATVKLIDSLPIDILKSHETVVLATSAEGVYFADKVADRLSCRMDILFTEPIYSDINPSLAIAMVGETEEIVMHKALIDAFDISKDYIYSEAKRRYNEDILGYMTRYRDGRVLDGLNKKFVLLVDECVETGLTIMTAIKTVIALGAKNVFIAVPILDNVVYKSLINICDDLFCPYKIDDYISIEYYYENLEEFTSQEVEKIVKNRKIIKEENE
ncbi:MAG: hypothetical protein GXO60_05570 [Epsilonproteobacteria bacterium]|nr:hypothetical protein [Campylobacterota bacterium]